MTWVLLVLAAWCLLPLPLACLVGRILRRGGEALDVSGGFPGGLPGGSPGW